MVMKKALLWTLAVCDNTLCLVYQRVTGPTYPMRGKAVDLADTEIAFRLLRTHESTHDCEIKIDAPSSTIEGYMEYKRYPTQDALSKVPMVRQGDALVGYLPKQLSSGKLQYKVFLNIKWERGLIFWGRSHRHPVQGSGPCLAADLPYHCDLHCFTPLYADRIRSL